MPLHSPLVRITSLVALALVASTALADDPPAPKPIPQAADIKPLPPVAIPDDPPPHEGAMFELPMTIEPPDILVVEVLEGLPGRPITGERLVRPDGMISLGFYGDVYVRGLTTEQAKVKIIHHLRKHLVDEVLGLIVAEGPPAPPPLGKPGSPVPESELQRLNRFNPDNLPPDEMIIEPVIPPPGNVLPGPDKAPSEPKTDRPPAATGRPSAARRDRDRQRTLRLARRLVQNPKPPAVEKPDEPEKKGEKPPIAGDPVPPGVAAGAVVPFKLVYINPADSPNVFVDVASHNTQVYYVQGDVGTPGRLPFTGRETVLDALNFAGGFIPIAEPADIHLYRPARGGKPAKDFKIDLAAIHKGEAKANLQVFPGDRLIVGRNPIVKKTVQVDRANALIISVLNTMLQYAFTARSLTAINSPFSNTGQQLRINGQNVPLDAAEGTAITPAQRDAMVREWVNFLWSISSKEGGAMLDEKAFREALLEKLRATPEPKK